MRIIVHRKYMFEKQPLALKLSALIILGLFAPSFAAAAAPVANPTASPFLYTFNAAGILDEAGSMGESTSRYFWLNSGAQMWFKEGIGQTVHGTIGWNTRWATLYRQSNARDTESGVTPQNLFRLVTRSTWDNFSEEVRFRIDRVNMSDSPERDGWSGVLLFSRYQDGDNLYYLGIRMDGHAVIKKKQHGSYTTLAEKTILAGSFNRITNPSLIPIGAWMGLKAETNTNADGSVSLTLSIDRGNGAYEEVLSVTDRHDPISGTGYAGIRTDFADVSFDNYRLTNI